MGKCAIRTYLDRLSVDLFIFRFSRAMRSQIQGTITKQTIEMFQPLMTGKIFTVPVFKKTIGMFHLLFLLYHNHGKIAAVSINGNCVPVDFLILHAAVGNRIYLCIHRG